MLRMCSQTHLVAVQPPCSPLASIGGLMKHFLERPLKPPVKLWNRGF